MEKTGSGPEDRVSRRGLRPEHGLRGLVCACGTVCHGMCPVPRQVPLLLGLGVWPPLCTGSQGLCSVWSGRPGA